MSRGQASMEFMVLFTLFLVAASVALYVSIDRTKEITSAQTGIEANSVVNRVTSVINSVYLQGDGFSTNLTLPTRIVSSTYTTQFQSNQLLLTVGNKLFTGYTLTDNITGNLSIGENVIKNMGGAITING